MSAPGLKPFFCYYGGKWRAALRYPAPRYDTIIEPFAGAAGYSTRYADRNVVLLEKDPTIAALWRYLIRVKPAEIRGLPLIYAGQTVHDLPVVEEARSLIGFWLNKGSAQPKLRPSTRFLSGVRPNSHWGQTVRDLIARQVERIRHWRIVEGSYVQIPRASREATWYVDPPYQRQGTYYRCSAKAIDFQHLGAWCQTLRGQVMVCEQEGADWLPFAPFLTQRGTQHRKGLRATCNEVLWQSPGPVDWASL